jgi:hypothetical protein
MPLDLARRIGVALDVRSETRIRQIDSALKEYVRLTPQSPTTAVPGNITASQVISGTFADGRISESSVTQHEAALEIDWLQLSGVPSTFTPSAHTHNASDINAGTMADARVAQSNVTQHQAALSLAATQLVSGLLADARVQESNVTQHEAALEIDWLQLTGVPSTFPPSAHVVTGSWTPIDSSGAGLVFPAAEGSYSIHEDIVIARARVAYPATASGATAQIGGLPATVHNSQAARQGFVSYTDRGALTYCVPANNTTVLNFYDSGGAPLTNAAMANRDTYFTAIYRAA